MEFIYKVHQLRMWQSLQVCPQSSKQNLPASCRCSLHKSKLNSYLQNSENPSFTIIRRWTLTTHGNNLVDSKIIFFGAKDCGTCGGPCGVCAQPTVWPHLLRPLLHSPAQIHIPHLLHETAVRALQPPFCLLQYALLGSHFFDNWCLMASFLCVNSSLELFLVPVVFLEVTLFDSAPSMWWAGVPNHCCHYLGKHDEGRKEQGTRSERRANIQRARTQSEAVSFLRCQLLHSTLLSARLSLFKVPTPKWGVE